MQTVVTAVVGSPDEGLSAIEDGAVGAIIVMPFYIAKNIDPQSLPPGMTVALIAERGLALIVGGQFREWIDTGLSRPLSVDLAIDVLGSRFPGRTFWVLRFRGPH